MNPEAIEAAAKADFGHDWSTASAYTQGVFLDAARVMLEAAAPYLIREARAAELEAAAYMFHHASGAAKALWDRAAAIRAGEPA